MLFLSDAWSQSPESSWRSGLLVLLIQENQQWSSGPVMLRLHPVESKLLCWWRFVYFFYKDAFVSEKDFFLSHLILTSHLESKLHQHSLVWLGLSILLGSTHVDVSEAVRTQEVRTGIKCPLKKTVMSAWPWCSRTGTTTSSFISLLAFWCPLHIWMRCKSKMISPLPPFCDFACQPEKNPIFRETRLSLYAMGCPITQWAPHIS